VTRILPDALVGLVLAASCAGLIQGASAQPASPTAPTQDPAGVDATDAARVYLSQSLAALQWARHYAGTAARAGMPETFDLDRYLAELDTIVQGLERYLRPEGPPLGPLTPVEITGQFLLDGLRGQTLQPDGGPRP
jgi:hypothetical protein